MVSDGASACLREIRSSCSFLSTGGTAAQPHPYSPSPPPPPPANYIPSPSRPSGQAPSSAAAPPVPPAADGRKPAAGLNVPMNDARSDLLAAIRRGQSGRRQFTDYRGGYWVTLVWCGRVWAGVARVTWWVWSDRCVCDLVWIGVVLR